MEIDSCYQLGYVIKKHGLDGEVNIFLDVDFPEDYEDLESVFVEINQKLVPFFLEYIQIQGNKAIVKFEDVDDVVAAEGMRGTKLFLPLESLPELEEGQFYFHQIIGYKVVDKSLGNVGKVVDVYSFPNQDLMAVDRDGKEVLIPINDDIVVGVSHGEQQVNVDMPEGLLEVYMND